MLPLLRAYGAAGRPVAVREVVAVIAADLGLSEADLALRVPKGRERLFQNRLHWAKAHLLKAGLLSSQARGQADITTLGKSVLASGPARIDQSLLTQSPEFVRWKSSVAKPASKGEHSVRPDPRR